MLSLLSLLSLLLSLLSLVLVFTEGGAGQVAKHSASEEARGHGEQEVSPEEAKQHGEAAGSLEELQEAAKEFDDAETGQRLEGKFGSWSEVRRRGEGDGEGAEEVGR